MKGSSERHERQDVEGSDPVLAPSPWGRHVAPKSDRTREDHSQEGRRQSVLSSVFIWSVQGTADSSNEKTHAKKGKPMTTKIYGDAKADGASPFITRGKYTGTTQDRRLSTITRRIGDTVWC